MRGTVMKLPVGASRRESRGHPRERGLPLSDLRMFSGSVLDSERGDERILAGSCFRAMLDRTARLSETGFYPVDVASFPSFGRETRSSRFAIEPNEAVAEIAPLDPKESGAPSRLVGLSDKALRGAVPSTTLRASLGRRGFTVARNADSGEPFQGMATLERCAASSLASSREWMTDPGQEASGKTLSASADRTARLDPAMSEGCTATVSWDVWKDGPVQVEVGNAAPDAEGDLEGQGTEMGALSATERGRGLSSSALRNVAGKEEGSEAEPLIAEVARPDTVRPGISETDPMASQGRPYVESPKTGPNAAVDEFTKDHARSEELAGRVGENGKEVKCAAAFTAAADRQHTPLKTYIPVASTVGGNWNSETWERLLESVAGSLRQVREGEVYRARLRLHPPQLGGLELEAEWSGSLKVSLEAQSPLAYHILREGLEQLRLHLASQGFALQDLRLSLRSGEGSRRGRGEAELPLSDIRERKGEAATKVIPLRWRLWALDLVV